MDMPSKSPNKPPSCHNTECKNHNTENESSITLQESIHTPKLLKTKMRKLSQYFTYNEMDFLVKMHKKYSFEPEWVLKKQQRYLQNKKQINLELLEMETELYKLSMSFIKQKYTEWEKEFSGTKTIEIIINTKELGYKLASARISTGIVPVA